MNKKIQIGIITYSKYSRNEKIINLIIYLLYKLAKYPDNIEFFIIFHMKKSLNLNIIKNFINKLNIKAKYFDLGNKLLSHCQTLEKMIFNYDADYGFFCDSDLICLQKNWDELFMNSLINKKIAMGTSYHIKESKYLKFPNIMGFFFKTKEFLSMCKKILEDKGATIFMGNRRSVRMKLHKGGRYGYYFKDQFIRCEIGFLLPYYFDKYNYEGIPFPCYRINGNFHKLKFSCNDFKNTIINYNKKYIRKNIGMTLFRRGFEEYHFNNELIFVHIGAGSSIRYFLFYQTIVFVKFLNKLVNYFDNEEIKIGIKQIFSK